MQKEKRNKYSGASLVAHIIMNSALPKPFGQSVKRHDPRPRPTTIFSAIKNLKLLLLSVDVGQTREREKISPCKELICCKIKSSAWSGLNAAQVLYTIVFERDAHYSYHDNRFFVAKRASKVQNVGFVIKKEGKKRNERWHVGHVDGQLGRYCEYGQGHAWRSWLTRFREFKMLLVWENAGKWNAMMPMKLDIRATCITSRYAICFSKYVDIDMNEQHPINLNEEPLRGGIKIEKHSHCLFAVKEVTTFRYRVETIPVQ